jgi:Cu+-exporting ATPase
MEKTYWKVEGMTCSNCALTISKYLEKQAVTEVSLNAISGELSFEAADATALPELKKGIENLGYFIKAANQAEVAKTGWLGNHKSRFLASLPLTLLLMSHMLPANWHFHFLMHPWVQLLLCLPVFLMGMYFFGRSAWRSLANGIPNMNALITVGALASFTYSITGMILQLGPDYMFFETTATIINLVFLGNYLEEASVQSTQKALKSLISAQKVMANMIAFDEHHQEQLFPIENNQLKSGDLVLIRSGEKVPADCKILWGDAAANESIITGESLPVTKAAKDSLIGGSILVSGTVKAQVTAAGNQTILAGIIHMVQMAQASKPPVQKMADKISAVFVPVVMGIALLTFLIGHFGFNLPTGTALMRAVAVLVISCPCAMGLATPSAIAVGLGRAARSGILFRNPSALESFKDIRQVVFDKTGTLTTGDFIISGYHASIEESEFKKLMYHLEKYSAHPLAKAIAREWKTGEMIRWKTIREIKGKGLEAKDNEDNTYWVGSDRILPKEMNASGHNIYLMKNDVLLGWVDLTDSLRPEAESVIAWLKKRNIRTFLLSGDKEDNCRKTAQRLGIDEVFAEQLPEDKLKKMEELTALAPTAMVGDGINDAPALAKATLGISLSDASQLAMQHADVVLMNSGLKQLPLAMGMGRHTFLTIKQNLFWAFCYNIVAIPIAILGMLTPGLAALAMGFSDVVLAANSVRLFVKKVN